MKVLVAITEPERESALVETAAALACDGEVVLASVIEVTGENTLASAQPDASGRRRDPPSDVAIVKGAPARARRILVPVRGGRYAQLAARLGIELAKAHDGSVTLLHVAEQGGGRQRSTLYQLLGERAYDERVERLV